MWGFSRILNQNNLLIRFRINFAKAPFYKAYPSTEARRQFEKTRKRILNSYGFVFLMPNLRYNKKAAAISCRRKGFQFVSELEIVPNRELHNTR